MTRGAPVRVVDERTSTSGGCCGPATLTMSDYIDRGMRRRRGHPLPVAGAVRYDDDGRFAQFSMRVSDGVMAEVTFDASMCVTLVAYCEVAAEWVTGLEIPAAVQRIRPFDLMAALPLVPCGKRGRAMLAAQALMAAVIESAKENRG